MFIFKKGDEIEYRTASGGGSNRLIVEILGCIAPSASADAVLNSLEIKAKRPSKINNRSMKTRYICRVLKQNGTPTKDGVTKLKFPNEDTLRRGKIIGPNGITTDVEQSP